MSELITSMIHNLVQYSEFTLTVLAILLPIFISTAFIFWQMEKTKRAEIEFRIYEQRSGAHNKLISLFFDLFTIEKRINDPTRKAEAKQKVIDDYMEIAKDMLIIASEDTIKIQSDLMKAAREQQSMLMIKKLGELILQVRADFGIKDKDLSNRRVLSAFITDIDDPKYDEIFKK